MVMQTINIVLNFYKFIANCVCYLQKSRQTTWPKNGEDCLAPKPVKSNYAFGFWDIHLKSFQQLNPHQSYYSPFAFEQSVDK